MMDTIEAIQVFLDTLAQDCDPMWKEQVEGIAENFHRFGALTPKQKRSAEIENHKLKRAMPAEWANLPIRQALDNLPTTNIMTGREREVLARCLDDIGAAVRKAAGMLRE